MLVIFPVYTSYEAQIVLHWQKSLLCWRDSLDLNQVINKCFSTPVNASNFIMSFTLCLPENPKLFSARNRLYTETPPLPVKSQLRAEVRQILNTDTRSGYMVSRRGSSLLGASRRQEMPADSRIRGFVSLPSLSSPTLYFRSLFLPAEEIFPSNGGYYVWLVIHMKTKLCMAIYGTLAVQGGRWDSMIFTISSNQMIL